ncbi:MAG: EscU/YscU/HrcU family type III secretion system export apparatus switch protein [Planctomycetota bacterium]|nr:EscU/YscU/HrcU family type III secretion system export apparatus switch protein [Planctomycetota bacterium]
MSENERVHEPSPVRLLQARQEGQVARSAELSRALMFCILLGMVFFLFGSFLELAAGKISKTLSVSHVSLDTISAEGQAGFWLGMFYPLVVFLSAVVGMVVLVWHFQFPLTPRFSRVACDLSRVSWQRGLGRLFSADNLVKCLLSLAALVALLLVAGSMTRGHAQALAGMAGQATGQSLDTALSFIKNVLVASGCILVVLGFADYLRERIRLAMQLRMTDQERRDEAREGEMNPETRRRIRGGLG